uniref:Uncharacterized protein n=1 Tax=Acrobeloides nanus TaxID=290746 RepID=A0A914D438_9BILA
MDMSTEQIDEDKQHFRDVLKTRCKKASQILLIKSSLGVIPKISTESNDEEDDSDKESDSPNWQEIEKEV